MIIKALTLWQPWASFMAVGMKKNETRSWGTSYRGPLAIHAATKIPQKGQIPLDVLQLATKEFDHWNYWPLGKILCVVELLGVWPTAYVGKIPNNKIELMLGDYSYGRHIWETKMLQVFDEPIPAKGKQGLWEWEWRKP
jgi:activating signal cointegrator 1